VNTWICRLYPNTEVICLQGLQANLKVVEMDIRTLFPDGSVEVDVTQEGRTRSVVIVSHNLKVLDQGHNGDGTFSWDNIQTSIDLLSIGSVYAPAEKGGRMRFWRWLHNLF
jgi:hypothetical protein